MKKIIRLTESDLARIVKRVIKEAETATTLTEPGKQAFVKIKSGVDGAGKEAIATGIYMIKTKEDYNTVISLIHSKVGKYSTILDYVSKVWGYWSQESRLFGIGDKSSSWIVDLERHLKYFNDKESASVKKTFLAPKG
jgi:hypothetical protein